jgi:hypothetical protein
MYAINFLNDPKDATELQLGRLTALLQIPVAARSKAWVYGRSLVIVGSNPAEGMDVCLL